MTPHGFDSTLGLKVRRDPSIHPDRIYSVAFGSDVMLIGVRAWLHLLIETEPGAAYEWKSRQRGRIRYVERRNVLRGWARDDLPATLEELWS